MPDIADSLMASPEFTDFLFNNLTTAIFLVDPEFRVRKVNDTYRSLFAKGDTEALNRLCGNSLGCQYAIEQNQPCGSTTACAECQIRKSLLKAFHGGNEVENAYVARTFYIDRRPAEKNFRLKFRKIDWSGQDMVIIAIDDITELEAQRKKIEEIANRDFLTGLNNRRGFYDLAEPLFQNAKRGNLSVAVAMFDIDHFKRINDSYGHDAGDFVIKSIADVLARNLRKADILARFGGEEFCLLMHYRTCDDAYTVVDKLRLLVERQAFLYEGKKIPVTISAGVTGKIEETLDLMIRRADETLYRAKQGGRNRTEEYGG
jgi:diguanylate cyclase (GGDEF)-like protein